MQTLTTKRARLAALRPLSPESVASLAAAWDVQVVYESNAICSLITAHSALLPSLSSLSMP